MPDPVHYGVQVPTMATLADLAEDSDMDDEMKEMMSSVTERDKFIPIAHGNECSFYDLMRFDILLFVVLIVVISSRLISSENGHV
jgi:hypothetical protein